MSSKEAKIFISYSRADFDFALKLGKDLRSAGANIWIDQLDVPLGEHWDDVAEKAFPPCPRAFCPLVFAPLTWKAVSVGASLSPRSCSHEIPPSAMICNIRFLYSGKFFYLSSPY